ncbi:hypothetical protein Leryth_016109 [Lithospermum erythrorhizon]|nr:hypothetical protein Leryth_016109 [Lithospermum erythrorhizon]
MSPTTVLTQAANCGHKEQRRKSMCLEAPPTKNTESTRFAKHSSSTSLFCFVLLIRVTYQAIFTSEEKIVKCDGSKTNALWRS